ncbi:hypothetical protein HMI54_001859 [Coelomomyces lativittatus]|nr:hypothetical protein HMI54_001859 [Coelomomyces lativittatus]KAJ1512429.1 hypothetical protein HMI56_004070 [Coelomomyces lativittatus]
MMMVQYLLLFVHPFPWTLAIPYFAPHQVTYSSPSSLSPLSSPQISPEILALYTRLKEIHKGSSFSKVKPSSSTSRPPRIQEETLLQVKRHVIQFLKLVQMDTIHLEQCLLAMVTYFQAHSWLSLSTTSSSSSVLSSSSSGTPMTTTTPGCLVDHYHRFLLTFLPPHNHTTQWTPFTLTSLLKCLCRWIPSLQQRPLSPPAVFALHQLQLSFIYGFHVLADLTSTPLSSLHPRTTSSSSSPSPIQVEVGFREHYQSCFYRQLGYVFRQWWTQFSPTQGQFSESLKDLLIVFLDHLSQPTSSGTLIHLFLQVYQRLEEQCSHPVGLLHPYLIQRHEEEEREREVGKHPCHALRKVMLKGVEECMKPLLSLPSSSSITFESRYRTKNLKHDLLDFILRLQLKLHLKGKSEGEKEHTHVKNMKTKTKTKTKTKVKMMVGKGIKRNPHGKELSRINLRTK